jgi:hypothetical protein
METNKKIAQPIQKKLFDVKINSKVDAILTFRILAETPEQALELIKNASPMNVQYKLNARRDVKAMIYDAGSLIIRFTKNLLGR